MEANFENFNWLFSEKSDLNIPTTEVSSLTGRDRLIIMPTTKLKSLGSGIGVG